MSFISRFALPSLALLCFTCALPAVAQSIKPGLWEMQTRMTHSNKAMPQAMAQMQTQMAQMPPAQRKQLEAMLAQQGVAMDGTGGMRLKACVTPEMAKRLEVPVQEGDCTTTPSKPSGNTMQFTYRCTHPDIRGEGTVTFVSPTQYRMHSEMIQTENGKAEKMIMDADGSWLSADCAGAANAPGKNPGRHPGKK